MMRLTCRRTGKYRNKPVIICLALMALFHLPGTFGTAEKPPTQCCFINPRYIGICVVRPKRGETCRSILAYLNNPNSAGKNYCEGTSLRGGWKRAECSTGKALP